MKFNRISILKEEKLSKRKNYHKSKENKCQIIKIIIINLNINRLIFFLRKNCNKTKVQLKILCLINRQIN